MTIGRWCDSLTSVFYTHITSTLSQSERVLYPNFIIIKIENVNNLPAYWDIQSFRWSSYKDSSRMYIAYWQQLECF